MYISVEKAMYILHLGGLLVNNTLGKLHLISEEKWDKRNGKHIMSMKRWFEMGTGLDFFDELKKDGHS